jgi:hypothetical protein
MFNFFLHTFRQPVGIIGIKPGPNRLAAANYIQQSDTTSTACISMFALPTISGLPIALRLQKREITWSIFCLTIKKQCDF